ncbi:MAG: biosynthetic-type acetolactate synthase large subunit [Desulfobacteraceae bacterium]|nr:biosynthetic-type acetolactate synthase large subunit [Desulfobacteraceae bacterium]
MTTQAAKIIYDEEPGSPPSKISGAQAVMEALVREKAEIIFGYPGGAIMPVYDALYSYQDRITHVMTRHEQGAVHAAQGFARATGAVGVCIATSGPGATNLITGLADAYMDSTPLVCITGQVASPLLGTDAFQETDIIGISLPVTKWNYQVRCADEIPHILSKAFYIARSGRPGPVLVDIAKDAQFAATAPIDKSVAFIRSYQPKPDVNYDLLKEAAALINRSERPFILFGQGVILGKAETEFRRFVEKSGIPAAWTLLGASALDSDHPLNVGMLGMHGNYAPNLLTNACDLLIALGMRFDDRVTGDVKRYAQKAAVIHIDIDASELNKVVTADVPIHGDLKQALPELTHWVEEGTHTEWVNRFAGLYQEERVSVIDPELFPSKPGLTMGEVVRRISERTNGDAIVVTDVGQHQMVAGRYFRFKESKNLITSGGLGTMGFGLPAGIGAKLGRPEKTVITIIGDGGFQMTLQELGTILQTGVALKIVILNNNFLGMVRQWQELFFEGRYSSTEMVNPDFVTIATGYHIKAEKVTRRSQLDRAIDNLLEHDGPCLLEAVVEKEDNVFPMVPAGASVSEVRLT